MTAPIPLAERRRLRTLKQSPHNPALRGFHVAYRPGEPTRCPGCGRRAWLVGRTTAECANMRCGVAIPIVGG